MSGTRNRVEVLHGVNLDHARQAGRRALRDADPGGAGGAHPPLGAPARPRDELLPHQLRGRVHRASAPGAAGRRRPRAQPGRVDALQLCDPRRARDRGGPRDRGAPVRRRQPRGMAPALGDRRPRHRPRDRQGARRLSRGARAARARARASSRRPRHERHGRSAPSDLAALRRGAGARPAAGQRPRERPLPDRLHRHQRRGADRPRAPRVPDRLPLRRAGTERRSPATTSCAAATTCWSPSPSWRGEWEAQSGSASRTRT